MKFQESKLQFQTALPALDYRECLLIYDRKLLKEWGAWIRRFPQAYPVSSGEQLKDLREFPKHVEKLMKISADLSPKTMQVVAFGGGSVGDFAGFFASVFKRGVSLIQIPSTWLAALDSAHGGKTALNVRSVKNQVGTFYPANQIFLVSSVLEKLGPGRFQEAWSEAIKVALLDSPALAGKVQKATDAKKLWKLLPALIKAKLKIVRRDPFEQKGIRHLLNLGHTVGHVLEAELGLSHGLAVGYGLRFALNWSKSQGLLAKNFELHGIPGSTDLAVALRKVRQARQLLMKDKKMGVGGRIRFVLLKRPGLPVIANPTVHEILQEIERQKR